MVGVDHVHLVASARDSHVEFAPSLEYFLSGRIGAYERGFIRARDDHDIELESLSGVDGRGEHMSRRPGAGAQLVDRER